MGKLDYDITCGLEEWKDDGYKITEDFYRLKVYTERLRDFLEEKTGRRIPACSLIGLTAEELGVIRDLIWEERCFLGLYGPYRARAFDIECFHVKGKDGLATEDELRCDYKFSEL